jgi:hypothetical protein
MPKNSSSFIDVTNVSANQMFVVDANLENAPSASAISVGGTLEEYPKRVKRITIGEPLKNSENEHEHGNENVKLFNSKKKTRRRHK